MGYFKVKAESASTYFRIRNIGNRNPTVKFQSTVPSDLPYDYHGYTFTSVDDKVLVWDYLTYPVPLMSSNYPTNSRVFGWSGSVDGKWIIHDGEECDDIVMIFDEEQLQYGTLGTLFQGMVGAEFAYIDEENSCTYIDIYRLSDNKKFTAIYNPETEKYFILDQQFETAGWVTVDELEDFGYSTTKIAETVTAYLSSNKSPISITMSYYYPVYDENGTRIEIEPEKSYLPKKYILSDDSEVMIPSADAAKTYFDMTSNQSPALSVYHTLTNNINNIVSLVYETRPANLITAWVSEDKTSQTVGPWSLKFLYDEEGKQIAISQGLSVVAYYYVNGEKIYNNDLYVRMSESGGKLRVGAKADVAIEKVEYSVQPVPTI